MTPPPQISFGAALLFWLKLGFVSFGGPSGQIAIMHAELVERRRWISEKRFLHALNYCMLLPGPEAQQLATYIGWLMHRTRGGIAAGALFVLPSLLILVTLAWIYLRFGQLPLVAGLLYGIKPAVTAIVLHATHRIGARALGHPLRWAIAGAAFVALSLLQLPFPLIVASAALAGIAGGRWYPQAFRAGGGHGSAQARIGPAIIDDDTPTPEHAHFCWSRLARVVACGLLLWALPLGVLALAQGASHTYTQMGWFFTKAALMTFGGAYAVLPYVWQGAVVHYGWLTPAQMIDGLALGETTPGPLIMVVAFVGFLGGYTQADAGLDPAIAGALAATIVTWFTFLPSFIFIFAGGPLVESTQDDLRFTAPLAAITAAVVGVVLNLAVFFAWHTLWPGGFAAGIDLPALALTLAALVALFVFRRGVISVIATCACAGLALHLLA